MVRYVSSVMASLGLLLGTTDLQAAFQDVAHPFILWRREEAAAIRKRIDSEPWAKASAEQLAADSAPLGRTYRNLFRHVVLEDRKAGEVERDYLLKIIGTHPSKSDSRHFDCYLDALRYDAVFDLLTPEQARQIEEVFREAIAVQLADTHEYTRTSWLPNMEWPRPMAAHLMAVALKDEKLIRALAAGNGGWKSYFDDYIADGYFYCEEFGKQYSMMGEMLLFCQGLQRLGLDELGYGYTGRGGATMRRYLEGIPRVGYPRTDVPAGRARYGRITMGDAKGGWREGPPFLFQQAFITGHLPDGAGGNASWMNANMNGRDHRNAKVDKFLEPLWFEMAHARWSDAGFDYFLAQMRSPGEEQYVPTLYFGLSPIRADRVKPPAAPSYVADERGFALLRAEEGPAYWESPAPAVSLQFATLYVHYLSDCFSLLGYQAFSRPIYVNRTIAHGYAGGPWDFHVRSHCGVVVDNLQAQPIGPVPQRHDFTPLAKFVSARTPHLTKPFYTGKEVRSIDQQREPALQVYPGVDLARSLLLTREYLFDIYQLSSDRPHAYHWLVHAPGEARPDDPERWALSHDLRKTLFDVPEIQIDEERQLDPGGQPWSLTTVQTCQLPDVSKSRLGKEWYDRRIGVRVSMLGEPGTTVSTFRTPTSYAPGSPRAAPQPRKGEPPAPLLIDEAGGVSLAVARRASNTAFIALHEPFQDGEHHIATFASISRDPHGVAVRIVGNESSLINDRVMVRTDEDDAKPLTLAGDGESFTFSNYGYIRIGRTKVEACGGLSAFTIRAQGNPRLIVNGKEEPATITAGFMRYGN